MAWRFWDPVGGPIWAVIPVIIMAFREGIFLPAVLSTEESFLQTPGVGGHVGAVVLPPLVHPHTDVVAPWIPYLGGSCI